MKYLWNANRCFVYHFFCDRRECQLNHSAGFVGQQGIVSVFLESTAPISWVVRTFCRSIIARSRQALMNPSSGTIIVLLFSKIHHVRRPFGSFTLECPAGRDCVDARAERVEDCHSRTLHRGQFYARRSFNYRETLDRSYSRVIVAIIY